MAAAGVIVDFELPAALEAAAPAEARGLRRDDIRLLVSVVDRDVVEHARFRDLPRWLAPGDVLVVNTSGTLNAALHATGRDGQPLALHLSTRLPGGFWTVEVRQIDAGASRPYRDVLAGETFTLPGKGEATLLAPYPLGDGLRSAARLWLAALSLPDEVRVYLDRFGVPIRYRYVTEKWPSSMYQTVFASQPGSAEMPSAGRPFTHELVTRLVSQGVQIAPVLLHTGVSSLEDHEPPYEEYFHVSRQTADSVNAARRAGHRIVAVGTTVVRALESVTDEYGQTSPGDGWTSLVISPDRRLRAVNALITGLHEPSSSHLMMLEQAIEAARRWKHGDVRPGAGSPAASLERAYREALAHRYLWHEFGDSHLIL